MFVDMGYLKLDVECLDDKDNQNIQIKELGIINIGGFMTMNVDILDTNEHSDIINKLEISLGDNIVDYKMKFTRSPMDAKKVESSSI